MFVSDIKYTLNMFKLLFITKNKDILNNIEIESRKNLFFVTILCFLYCFLCFFIKFFLNRYLLFTFLNFVSKILSTMICFIIILSLTYLGLYIYCLIKQKENLFD